MMISRVRSVNNEILDMLKMCTSWEDLEKTNYTKYLDETFSEYMKSLYRRIDDLKNDVYKVEKFSETESLKSPKLNRVKLIELKKCQHWEGLIRTGYAQHIDRTFEAYMRFLYQSTKRTLWMVEKESLLSDLVNLGRGKNLCDKIDELSVENLFEYKQETLIPNLPLEIGLTILQFLPPKDLCKTSRVNTDWYKVTWHNELWKNIDLTKSYSKLNIIDKTVWERHVDLKELGLTFKSDPGVHKRNLLPVLKELFDLNVEGVTLITLPEGLDEGKILKIGNVSYDTPHIYSGSSNRQYCVPSHIETIKKTKIVAVTNSVIKGVISKNGQQHPHHLSILATMVLTNKISKTYLYGNDINSYGNYSGFTRTAPSDSVVGYFGNNQNPQPMLHIQTRGYGSGYRYGMGATRWIKSDVDTEKSDVHTDSKIIVKLNS